MVHDIENKNIIVNHNNIQNTQNILEIRPNIYHPLTSKNVSSITWFQKDDHNGAGDKSPSKRIVVFKKFPNDSVVPPLIKTTVVQSVGLDNKNCSIKQDRVGELQHEIITERKSSKRSTKLDGCASYKIPENKE